MSRQPVTFTFDLEDHRPTGVDFDTRYPGLTRQVLAQLETHGIAGTFFVLGRIAEDDPELIREIADMGHEIALHSWDHTPLPELTPERFRDETVRGKKLLEDLTGAAVEGYRAPVFSLVPKSGWAPEVLAELGFSYSSSVLPAWNPLYGWPDAPATPFLWPSGLVELPCPVQRMGTESHAVALPYLGGVYARVLPLRMTGLLLTRQTSGNRPSSKREPQAPWMYAHPYDFDVGEPYWQVPELGPLGSRLLWLNRKRMPQRITDLVAPNPGPPLRLVADRLAGTLPVFSGDSRTTDSPGSGEMQ